MGNHEEMLLTSHLKGIDRNGSDERTCHEALWGFSSCLPVAGLHWLFCGHATVSAPTRIGNLRFIDTGVYEGGPLTVLPIA